jgi:DNA topoisomerase I
VGIVFALQGCVLSNQGRRKRIGTAAGAVREAAQRAGLRYVTPYGPCIRRRRAGRGFFYLGVDGRPLRDPRQRERIRRLAIPPAWRNVWICPLGNGHLQAVGLDARGRKQYRYHPRWRIERDRAKFDHVLGFARTLPEIRARVRRDLARPGLSRQKVLATVVRLLETTFARIGNREYVRANGSFGLTTLRTRHVEVAGSRIRMDFPGKSGKRQRATIADRRLARIVQGCRQLPGQALFQYLDAAGRRAVVTSADVNAYLKDITGASFTAKDFRTWAGTVLAGMALGEYAPAKTKQEGKQNIVRAIGSVATQLGNTPAICRKSYIHPALIDAYTEGVTLRWRPRPSRRASSALRPEETAVCGLIARWRRRAA